VFQDFGPLNALLRFKEPHVSSHHQRGWVSHSRYFPVGKWSQGKSLKNRPGEPLLSLERKNLLRGPVVP